MGELTDSFNKIEEKTDLLFDKIMQLDTQNSVDTFSKTSERMLSFFTNKENVAHKKRISGKVEGGYYGI